jgi:hypothetical protein
MPLSFRQCALAIVAALGCSATAVAQPVNLDPVGGFSRGSVVTISPDVKAEETYHLHDMIEITSNTKLQWQPQTFPVSRTLYSKAQNVRFGHDVWGLQFSFKPLRMINVGGRPVWYLVYRVNNTGTRLQPQLGEDGQFSAQPGSPQPVTFSGQFVLESHDRDATGARNYKAYLDRIIPEAVEIIRERELPQGKLLTTPQLAAQPIEVSTDSEDNSVWGVAMWEQVDPEINFMSIYVGGLTNAYRWIDPEGAYQPGDPAGKGRRLVSKALQLNFWRTGDEFAEHEREMRFGIPKGRSDLYGVEEGVAYRWTFR